MTETALTTAERYKARSDPANQDVAGQDPDRSDLAGSVADRNNPRQLNPDQLNSADPDQARPDPIPPGPLRLRQTDNPADVELELFTSSLQNAWLMVYFNLSIALLIGILQITSGDALEPALYGFVARSSASMVASGMLLPLAMLGRDWMRVHRRRSRILLAAPDAVILSVTGLAALAYVVPDDYARNAQLMVTLGGAAVVSAVLAPRIEAALPLGRLLVFLPILTWLLVVRPPYWGLLLALAVFSFAVSLAIVGWVYVQALRAADVAVRLTAEHTRSRGLAGQLAVTLRAERGAAEQIRTEALLRERFVHAVTHDLRQSLSALRLHGQNFARQHDTPEMQALTGLVQKGLASADATIESVAQAAWLAQTQPPDLRAVSLNRMLTGIVQETQALAQQAGIALRMVPTSHAVLAEPNYLERALRNLVHNAVQHSGGRRVLLGVKRYGDRVALVVADDGCGIAPKVQDRIFDRFYQASDPAARTAGSVGLGLATVQELIQRMGGTVALRSIEGRGTTFRLLLPRASAPQEVLSTGRILVMDDNPVSLDTLTATAQALGWTTIRCDSPQAARAAMKQDHPDACLFDFFLGDKATALDVLATLNADQKARTMVVSSHIPGPIAARLRGDGIEVANKPLSAARLGLFLNSLRAPAE